MLLADGLEDAFIGVASRCGQPDLAVYNIEKAVQVLVDRDGMDPDEAREFLEFNSIGAWVGDGTPLWLSPMTISEMFECYSDPADTRN